MDIDILAIHIIILILHGIAVIIFILND